MAQLMDHVEYLSQEIGPRPAGTEEEQEAALYITEQFQQDTGFTAVLEDFSGAANIEAGQAVLALVSIVVTILAVIFPVLAIPAFLLATAAAVVFALEAFDRPLLSKFLSRGDSQNVVAKYQPSHEEGKAPRGRSRKIIVLAHYDTGKVTPGLVNRLESTGLPIGLVCVIAMVVVAFFALIRIFVASSGGMGLLVVNVLSILGAIVCLVPVLKMVLMRTAPYNEGANNNATGTAALIEVARRIAHGSVSEADLALAEEGEDVTIHGEEAAREAGLIPEGAQIRYESEKIAPPEEIGDYDDEERLLSAKAAIAALTGKPIEHKVYGSVADKLVNSRAEEQDYQPEGLQDDVVAAFKAESAAQSATGYNFDALNSTASDTVGGYSNAPSWFVAAQQNARKTEDDGAEATPVQRSKYSEAFDHAERERAQREAEIHAIEEAARMEEQRRREEELRKALEESAREREAARAAVAAAAEKTMAEEPEPPADYVSPYAATRNREAALDVEPIPVEEPAPVEEPTPGEEPAPREYLVEREEKPAEASIDEEEQDREPIRVPEVDSGVAPNEELNASLDRTARHQRIAELPKIRSDKPSVKDTTSPSRSGLFRTIRANVPSLSGIINPVKDEEAEQRRTAARHSAATSVPSVIPEKVTLPDPENMPAPTELATPDQQEALKNSTIAMPHVDYNVELPALDEVYPKEGYASRRGTQPAPAQDARAEASHNRDYLQSRDVNATQEAAVKEHFANEPAEDAAGEQAPVSMPSSRSGGLLNRLRGESGSNLDDTPQQWLDVDKDFEPRKSEHARGGWESFRSEQDFDDDDNFGDFGTDDSERNNRRRWNGGAYSRSNLGRVDMRSGEESEADEPVPEEVVVNEENREISEEIEQIYHFRNPLFNNEIWFVAIGSDGDGHDGAKAFIEEHRDELRGAMMIEVESLGAGVLSFASEEGAVRKIAASSRVKRFTRNATAATGMPLNHVSLVGRDSIASTIQKAGFQAMHLFGAENGRPALKGSADDVLENVDEVVLDEHVNYLFELLKG